MPSDEFRLSDRDFDLLHALAQQRVAVMAQAAHWLGVSDRTAGQRVARLRAAGLVDSRRVFDRGSAMVRITGAGLKLIGSPLGRPGQKLDEYRHDVGVGWIWTAAQEGAFGEMTQIHSERAIRSHDARLERMSAGQRLGAVDPQLRGVGAGAWLADGRPERHYPDLLLESAAGHRIAVELELTHKGSRRLDRVMDAYASDARIHAVLYFVPDSKLADQVRAAASRAAIADRVAVRRLGDAGIGGIATMPSRARTRPALRRDRDAPLDLDR